MLCFIKHRKCIYSTLRSLQFVRFSSIDSKIPSNSDALPDINFKNPSLIPELKQTVTILPNTLLKNYLTSKKIKFEYGYTCVHLECPFCKQKPKGKLFLNKISGWFICYNCFNNGTWENFKELFTNLSKTVENTCKKMTEITKTTVQPLDLEQNNLIKRTFAKEMAIKSLDKEKFIEISNKFNLSGLTRKSLSAYNIKVSADEESLVFPLEDWNKKLIGLKYQHWKTHLIETIPAIVSPHAVFGWGQVNQQQTHIIVTTSPLDAIVLSQETNCPTIALPTGCQRLPQEILPFFEKFEKIILWFGNSSEDWLCSKRFSKKLGEKRCFYINSLVSLSPLQALQAKKNIMRMLESVQPIDHPLLTKVSSIKEGLLAEIYQKELIAGIKWTRYSTLNKILKGHRLGELTVLTGPSGSGKTTFLSEYSLDLCMQGVRTLWGSFEIKNVRLAKTMLTQYSQTVLNKLPEEKLLSIIDDFEKLPLYFMLFHGQESIRKVEEVMNHAVYVNDIQHIIIDNLQFMLGTSDNGKGDRFLKQDMIIGMLRKFATINNCHVSLVIHPRKEMMEELTVNSIYGGGKASQEADNVLILQDRKLNQVKSKKYIQVAKNRFDGDLGMFPITFVKDTCCYNSKKIINPAETAESLVPPQLELPTFTQDTKKS